MKISITMSLMPPLMFLYYTVDIESYDVIHIEVGRFKQTELKWSDVMSLQYISMPEADELQK